MHTYSRPPINPYAKKSSIDRLLLRAETNWPPEKNILCAPKNGTRKY